MCRRTWVSCAWGIALLVVVVAGCTPPATLDPTLNVLCSPAEEWCRGMAEEFQARTGINVHVVRLSSGEALARIRLEKDDPQFDLWWGGPIDGYIAAKQEGLLAAYNSANVANLIDAAKYHDADNIWTGIYVGTLGFCTSQAWLDAHPGVAAPTSWADLLKPEFRREIVMAHPYTSGTAYTALATLLQLQGEARGWGYLAQLNGQVREYTRSGARPVELVAGGAGAVCIAFSHDIVTGMETRGDKLVLTFPEDGAGYEIGGMAILKGAKHARNAQRWYDWALTPEAQALGPKYGAFQAPTVSGVTLSHPGLLEVRLIDYDFQWAGAHKKEFVERFTSAIAGTGNLRE
jgi:iron(III) transport system substrate-binding protein